MSDDTGGLLQIAGGGIGVLGALYSGEATAESLNAQANINDENAQVAIQQGNYDSYRQGLKVSSALGSMRAAYGGNGISASSGSALAVIQSSVMNGEMDRQNIIHGAAIKAISFQNEAAMERAGATNATTASYFNALSAGIGSGAKAFGSTASGGSNGDSSDGGDEGEESGDEL